MLARVCGSFNLTCISLESSGWGLNKSVLQWGTNFFTAVGVFPIEFTCQAVNFSIKLLATNFQWSVIQIGQDSFIYFYYIILG